MNKKPRKKYSQEENDELYFYFKDGVEHITPSIDIAIKRRDKDTDIQCLVNGENMLNVNL
jgi:hypothetical protein|tara:strand:+ start:17010 stop:17189 length:180 start_codon:yes stop_codon:yes gene_type:complete